MPCDVCGGVMVAQEVDEPSEQGLFNERYECANCGAKGFISGNEQDPASKWNRYGRAFDNTDGYDY